MRSRGLLEIAKPSWMSYAPQGVTGHDDNDDDNDETTYCFSRYGYYI
jgi:hypothetical protein